jgi:phosphatidylglycerol---prolipoprotein diacylglyceryl transferase
MSALHTFWQELPSHMSPVIFQLGSFRVQWYGLMYLAAFFLTYLLARYRMRTESRFQMHDDDFLKDLLTWAFVGVLLGGRFGYVFFYNFEYYLQHPIEIIFPFRHTSSGWQFTGISGMSYHGGLIGAIMGPYLFCRKHKADFWNLCDLFFPIAPLGYTFGRLGNFINGELWGRETTSAWGMRFPDAPGEGLRHPSQLYEAFFEGIVLFAILFLLRKRGFPKGAFTGLYLIGYGIFRFGIEFVRQPDAHLGLLFFGAFSMGQALCFAMIAVGIGFYVYRARVAARPAKVG